MGVLSDTLTYLSGQVLSDPDPEEVGTRRVRRVDLVPQLLTSVRPGCTSSRSVEPRDIRPNHPTKIRIITK